MYQSTARASEVSLMLFVTHPDTESDQALYARRSRLVAVALRASVSHAVAPRAMCGVYALAHDLMAAAKPMAKPPLEPMPWLFMNWMSLVEAPM